jgi:hypothetical protein
VEYCNSNSSITSSGINWSTTTTDVNSYVSDGLGSTSIKGFTWPDTNHIKSKVIEGVVDGEVELYSLVCKGETEVYDIEDITFRDKKNIRIACQKEIDLSYIENLKRNSQLLLEFFQIESVDYKKDAIEHHEGLLHFTGTGILININNPPLTWTYVPGNTTCGTATISTNPDFFSTTGNISCA